MVKITDNKFDDLMLQFELNTVRHFLLDFKP